MHKHLGVIFSSDCKWTKHIDVLNEKTSKQLNILRKLKYRLKRDYLEKIYLVFIRPILEYASEVWDECGQTNCNRLEIILVNCFFYPMQVKYYHKVHLTDGQLNILAENPTGIYLKVC
jgi:hypothetical protein